MTARTRTASLVTFGIVVTSAVIACSSAPPAEAGPLANEPGDAALREEAASPSPSDSASDSKVIGVGGGTLRTKDGRLTIDVPADALSADQQISASPRPDAPPPLQTTPVGTTYELGPEGLVFARPARLTFAWDPARAPAPMGPLDGLLVSSGPKDAPASALVPSAAETVDATHVATFTSHFSRWTPAWYSHPACGDFRMTSAGSCSLLNAATGQGVACTGSGGSLTCACTGPGVRSASVSATSCSAPYLGWTYFNLCGGSCSGESLDGSVDADALADAPVAPPPLDAGPAPRDSGADAALADVTVADVSVPPDAAPVDAQPSCGKQNQACVFDEAGSTCCAGLVCSRNVCLPRAAAPGIAPASGSYAGPITATLTTAMANATIHWSYAVRGTNYAPSGSGPSPLTIVVSQSGTLSATTSAPGYADNASYASYTLTSGCVPITCQQGGYTCGSMNNGCGGTVTCPTCPTKQYCSSGSCAACITSGKLFCQPSTAYECCSGVCLSNNTCQ